MTDKKKLVQTWIEFQNTKNPKLEWAHEDFIDLANEEPETAWECILGVIEIESSEEVLAHLAEGPLEDLLAEHGPTFIDRIEDISKNNIVFARLIKKVWVDGIAADIQNNVRTIQSKYG